MNTGGNSKFTDPDGYNLVQHGEEWSVEVVPDAEYMERKKEDIKKEIKKHILAIKFLEEQLEQTSIIQT